MEELTLRILVNASTLRGGGGVQKAVEFIRASVANPGPHQFCYALSDVVADNVGAQANLEGRDVTILPMSPARPVSGVASRATLCGIEQRFQPDVVYSVFGPAYVRFRSPHLMGFAVPWVTHPNRYAWRAIRNPAARAAHWVWCRYVTLWARYADRWVLETDVAANGLSRALSVDPSRFHVVPNSCAEQYDRARVSGVTPFEPMRKSGVADFNVLVFARWYPHKGLETIPAVAAELLRRDPHSRYRFFLTFDTESSPWKGIRRDAERLAVADRVVNLGPIPIADGPRLYASCDAVFLPTLLEVYSATYPEAMSSGRPIVTTDLPFARDVCGDAALYFPPNDVGAAAKCLMELAANARLRVELVGKGDRLRAEAKKPAEIYGMFIEVLEVTARDRELWGKTPRAWHVASPGEMTRRGNGTTREPRAPAR
jgi:glycosyltransferase involved in cell wall biosynthesis